MRHDVHNLSRYQQPQCYIDSVLFITKAIQLPLGLNINRGIEFCKVVVQAYSKVGVNCKSPVYCHLLHYFAQYVNINKSDNHFYNKTKKKWKIDSCFKLVWVNDVLYTPSTIQICSLTTYRIFPEPGYILLKITGDFMTTDHHQPHSVLSWKKIALLSGQNKKVIINYSVNVFFSLDLK